jgi:hypothetical protein
MVSVFAEEYIQHLRYNADFSATCTCSYVDFKLRSCLFLFFFIFSITVEVSDLADPEEKSEQEESDVDPDEVELTAEDHSYVITMDL